MSLGNARPRWENVGRAIGTNSTPVLKYRPKPPKVEVITHRIGTKPKPKRRQKILGKK